MEIDRCEALDIQALDCAHVRRIALIITWIEPRLVLILARDHELARCRLGRPQLQGNSLARQIVDCDDNVPQQQVRFDQLIKRLDTDELGKRIAQGLIALIERGQRRGRKAGLRHWVADSRCGLCGRNDRCRRRYGSVGCPPRQQQHNPAQQHQATAYPPDRVSHLPALE